MNIKLTSRLFAAALMSLAAGCQGEEPQTPAGTAVATQEVKAEQTCIEVFKGIKSCATGRATLKRSEQGLSVSNLNDAKQDGVSNQFAQAGSWGMDAAISGLSDKKQGLALAARDGDQVVSTLRIGLGGEQDQLIFAPSFTGGASTGSTYYVNVYQNKMMIISHLPPIDRVIQPWWWDSWWYWYPIHVGFGNHLSTGPQDPISSGACIWTVKGGPQAFSLEVDGRTITGDELEFVEVVGDGHYPYTSFSGIDVTGAASDFTILGQSITAAK